MKLVITQEDEAIFEKLAQQRFIKELNQYCESSFPVWVQKMGKDQSISALNSGLNLAEKIGMKERGSIYLHINLSILLGHLYHQDKQYQKLMNEYDKNTHWSETEKVKVLYQNVVNYMQQVAGEENDLFIQAINNLEQIEALKIKDEHFDADMLMLLKHCYPQKITHVESTNYYDFIKWGKIRAQNNYDLTQPNQWATYIMLMFYLGQYFDTDPFLTWFHWSACLSEIKYNQFNFNRLSEQLKKIWKLKEK